MAAERQGSVGNGRASRIGKEKIMKKTGKLLVVALVIVLALSVLVLAACDDKTDKNSTATKKVVRISTTTSVNDSGLMDYLQPYFKADTGYDWEIASAGTGAAIAAAKNGNADVILVHSKSQEDAFVEAGFARKVDGYAAERISFMHNFFVLVGPSSDPAGIKAIEATSNEVKDGFAAIATTGSTFISRGDASGTHTAEVKLWPSSLNITSDPASAANYSWYVSAGQGMGACLTMANERNAYVLTDKATFLSYKNNADGDKLPNLQILWEESASMQNTYSILAVNPKAPFTDSVTSEALAEGTVKIDTAAADVFVNWMNSVHARYLISRYGIQQYGESLFTLDELALTF